MARPVVQDRRLPAPGSDLAGETAAAMAASSIVVPADRPDLRGHAAHARQAALHLRRHRTAASTATASPTRRLLQLLERLQRRAGVGRDLAVPRHRRRQPTSPRPRRTTPTWPAEPADHASSLQVDASPGTTSPTALRPARQADRQAAVPSTTPTAGSTGGPSASTAPKVHATRPAARPCSTSGDRCATPRTPRSSRWSTRDSTSTDATRKARYHDFAVRQIDYALGDNPRNSQLRRRVRHQPAEEPAPPHRARLLAEQPHDPDADRHVLYGALVGGPSSRRTTRTPTTAPTTRRTRSPPTTTPASPARWPGSSASTAARRWRTSRRPRRRTGRRSSSRPPSTRPARTSPRSRRCVNNKSAWPARALTNALVPLLLHPRRRRHAAASHADRAVQPVPGARPGPTQCPGNVYYITVDCTGHAHRPGGPVASTARCSSAPTPGAGTRRTTGPAPSPPPARPGGGRRRAPAPSI